MTTASFQAGLVEHDYVATNGVTLHVAKAGPRDGPLVILLHGFPDAWFGWERVIEHLARQGFRVWAPDQRGYNLSEKPKGIGSYRLDLLADDIAGLISAAGGDAAHIVGHDWGGLVAWWLAMRHPARVRKLAVLNMAHLTVMLKYLRGSLRQVLKSWYVLAFQLPRLPEAVIRRDNWSFAVRSLVGSSRRGTFGPATLDRYRAAWSQPGALTGMINWYRAALWHRPRLPDDVRVHVPSLILWGTKDKFLDVAMAQPSADLCDDARLVLLPELTHWVQHEDGERISQLLADFFS